MSSQRIDPFQIVAVRDDLPTPPSITIDPAIPWGTSSIDLFVDPCAVTGESMRGVCKTQNIA